MPKQRSFHWKELLFSKTILKKGKAHKIAYIAVMTALCVAANMFFEFKFMDTQFSLTIAVSALMGLLLGPVFGFCACFLGDLLGFLANTGGFTYMPWVGLALGATAFVAGVVMAALPLRFKGALANDLKKMSDAVLSFVDGNIVPEPTGEEK